MPNDHNQRLKQWLRLGATLIVLVGMLTWAFRRDPSPNLRNHALLIAAAIGLSVVGFGVGVQALSIAITGRNVFRKESDK